MHAIRLCLIRWGDALRAAGAEEDTAAGDSVGAGDRTPVTPLSGADAGTAAIGAAGPASGPRRLIDEDPVSSSVKPPSAVLKNEPLRLDTDVAITLRTAPSGGS